MEWTWTYFPAYTIYVDTRQKNGGPIDHMREERINIKRVYAKRSLVRFFFCCCCCCFGIKSDMHFHSSVDACVCHMSKLLLPFSKLIRNGQNKTKKCGRLTSDEFLFRLCFLAVRFFLCVQPFRSQQNLCAEMSIDFFVHLSHCVVMRSNGTRHITVSIFDDTVVFVNTKGK